MCHTVTRMGGYFSIYKTGHKPFSVFVSISPLSSCYHSLARANIRELSFLIFLVFSLFLNFCLSVLKQDLTCSPGWPRTGFVGPSELCLQSAGLKRCETTMMPGLKVDIFNLYLTWYQELYNSLTSSRQKINVVVFTWLFPICLSLSCL